MDDSMRNSMSNKDKKNNTGYIDSIIKDITSSRLKQAFIMSEILNKPVSKREKSNRRYLRRKP